MRTDIGAESYALIEQGRIGQILSSRPTDRRAIIEEAAGITKFKTKKRLAEDRLEESKQNLSRVNDIFEEVTRQMNSLKRQASKAERYAKLRDEMRGNCASCSPASSRCWNMNRRNSKSRSPPSPGKSSLTTKPCRNSAPSTPIVPSADTALNPSCARIATALRRSSSTANPPMASAGTTKNAAL